MFKEIDGLKVNYVIEGEGDSVVLLHGWGADITLFDNLIHLLSPKYRVIALDMPGFGLSQEPPEAWDVDRYTDFVVAFLEGFVSGEKITLLGHSFGGRVVIKMNAREFLPFEIEKIILVDSAGVMPRRTVKQKMVKSISQKSKKFLENPKMNKVFAGPLEALKKLTGSADYLAASPVMRQTLVKVVNEDLTHLFPLVTAPTLLIWGRLDDATPLSDGQLMEQTMKNAGLVVLENCGHFSFLEQQYTFNRVIASFMKLDE